VLRQQGDQGEERQTSTRCTAERQRTRHRRSGTFKASARYLSRQIKLFPLELDQANMPIPPGGTVGLHILRNQTCALPISRLVAALDTPAPALVGCAAEAPTRRLVQVR
jgi:hypothetical protein